MRYVAMLLLLATAACEGPMGPSGPEGPAGPEGAPGAGLVVLSRVAQFSEQAQASVTFGPETGATVEAAVVNCWVGGSATGPWTKIALSTVPEITGCYAETLPTGGMYVGAQFPGAGPAWYFLATAAIGATP